ncbi:hypothetical protein BH23CHL8_BH23CHL8_29810 [soil metagenome]
MRLHPTVAQMTTSVALMASVAGCSLVGMPTGMTDAPPSQPPLPTTVTEFSTSAREVVHFDTLRALTDRSVVVVDARVVDVRSGHSAEIGEDARIRFTRATLEVVEELAGDGPPRISIEEDGLLVARSQVGDRGNYFLVRQRGTDDDVFRLINSQGRYRQDASGQLHASNPTDDLANNLEALGLAGLRDRVRSVD